MILNDNPHTAASTKADNGARMSNVHIRIVEPIPPLPFRKIGKLVPSEAESISMRDVVKSLLKKYLAISKGNKAFDDSPATVEKPAVRPPTRKALATPTFFVLFSYIVSPLVIYAKMKAKGIDP